MGEWFRVLAAMLLCFQCTSGAPVLTQPASISTSLGKTARITCSMTGGNVGNYYTSWYMQKPGNAPAFVWIDNNSARGPGIPSRFSGSRDILRNVMHLTIANVQATDVADYYCGAFTGYYIYGKGTKLYMGAPRAPKISVLPPSSEQITEKGKATVVCFINGFKPGVVEVEWTVDSSVRGNGVETSRVLQEADNTFSVSSYLTLSAAEWNSHELYSCVVKHEASASPLKTSIKRSNCA